MRISSGLSPESAGAIIGAAADAILVARRDGSIALANESAARLFEYALDEITSMHVDDLVPDAVRTKHRAHRTRYGASPRIRQMGDPGARLSAQRSDGALIPVEISLSPAEVGGEQLVVAVVRDVTDRLLVEAENESIRASLDAVDDAVFMFDPDSLLFSYVNVGAIAHTGYSLVDLVGVMTPLHIKPEFDEQTFRALLAPLLDETKHSLTFETIHRGKTGVDVPVEINLSYPRTDQHLRRSMVAIVRDIRDRRAAEERLRSSEEAFRSAFDDAAVPMAIVDLEQASERRIIQANQAFADMLGYSIDEMVGCEMSSFTHPDDDQSDTQKAELLVGGSEFYRTEKRYLRSDGTYRWGALRASLLVDSDGTRRSLAHIIDVTRQVRAETERDRRERLLDSLAGIRKASLEEAPLDEVLQLIAERTNASVDGCHCVIATPIGEGEMICRAIDSISSEDRTGEIWPLTDTIAGVMASGVREANATLPPDLQMCAGDRADTFTATMVVPLTAATGNPGVLIVCRSEGKALFEEDDLAAASALAAEAAVAMVLVKARDDRQRMFLAEDRERIARDLHDLVIQQLFATGMRLQAASGHPELLTARIDETVDQLDETIGVIRQTIFHLTRDDDSLSGAVERLVDRHRAIGRNDVELTVSGDIESIPSKLWDHLLPTLNELLSNVERHADATRATVTLSVGLDLLTLEVSDDGLGMTNTDSGGFGLANLSKRARAVGGQLEHGPGQGGHGTSAVWSVPLGEPKIS